MKPLTFFPFFLFLSILTFSYAQQQPYIGKNPHINCNANNDSYSFGYICNGAKRSCHTYLTFRSQTSYQTPSQIAALLNSNSSSISQLNGIPNNSPIPIDELVIIPTSCSCAGSYYQHNASYTITTGETYLSIANKTYQGLSTCQKLIAQNPYDSQHLVAGMKIQVPLRCGCPTRDQINKSGVKYLLTYLITPGDDLHSIARKLNVDFQSILDASGLSYNDTIYSFTTLLIPMDAEPTKSQMQSLQPPSSSPDNWSTKKGLYIGIGIVTGFLIFCGILCRCLCCFRRLCRKDDSINQVISDPISYFKNQENEGGKRNEIDLPLFDFDTIAAATDYFSAGTKLGEGGFGPVYKGKLGEDKEIAIKRLARTSQQGIDEFKNEVMLIAKLQHRNLVRLLGCCIQREERMLIYEFMPNKSLDASLFGKGEDSHLDWKTRYQIIIGITRGLLYLHHDSRFRIIHRDLKASNILLDKDMNPKISDFGIARIFGGDETDFSTRKVVGTYGYMSPEYALSGIFSVKSDVFSFGVLVLEIVTGKKNRGVYPFSPHLNLLGHAWSLWNEGKSLQLVDESIIHSFPMNEVLKCINIGLLCVQERPEDRPLMSSVIQMLGSEVASLPQPKCPGLVARIGPHVTHSSSNTQDSYSSNDMTVTRLEGR